MADEADIGTDAAEEERQYQMEEVRRNAAKLEAEATGECLFCGDPVKEKGRRWCCVECRDSWELQKKGSGGRVYAE